LLRGLRLVWLRFGSSWFCIFVYFTLLTFVRRLRRVTPGCTFLRVTFRFTFHWLHGLRCTGLRSGLLVSFFTLLTDGSFQVFVRILRIRRVVSLRFLCVCLYTSAWTFVCARFVRCLAFVLYDFLSVYTRHSFTNTFVLPGCFTWFVRFRAPGLRFTVPVDFLRFWFVIYSTGFCYAVLVCAPHTHPHTRSNIVVWYVGSWTTFS